MTRQGSQGSAILINGVELRSDGLRGSRGTCIKIRISDSDRSWNDKWKDRRATYIVHLAPVPKLGAELLCACEVARAEGLAELGDGFPLSL